MRSTADRISRPSIVGSQRPVPQRDLDRPGFPSRTCPSNPTQTQIPRRRFAMATASDASALLRVATWCDDYRVGTCCWLYEYPVHISEYRTPWLPDGWRHELCAGCHCESPDICCPAAHSRPRLTGIMIATKSGRPLPVIDIRLAPRMGKNQARAGLLFAKSPPAGWRRSSIWRCSDSRRASLARICGAARGSHYR